MPSCLPNYKDTLLRTRQWEFFWTAAQEFWELEQEWTRLWQYRVRQPQLNRDRSFDLSWPIDLGLIIPNSSNKLYVSIGGEAHNRKAKRVLGGEADRQRNIRQSLPRTLYDNSIGHGPNEPPICDQTRAAGQKIQEQGVRDNSAPEPPEYSEAGEVFLPES